MMAKHTRATHKLRDTSSRVSINEWDGRSDRMASLLTQVALTSLPAVEAWFRAKPYERDAVLLQYEEKKTHAEILCNDPVFRFLKVTLTQRKPNWSAVTNSMASACVNRLAIWWNWIYFQHHLVSVVSNGYEWCWLGFNNGGILLWLVHFVWSISIKDNCLEIVKENQYVSHKSTVPIVLKRSLFAT